MVEGYYDERIYDSLVYRTEPFIPVCLPVTSLSGNREQLKG